jgi:repressor LexA
VQELTTLYGFRSKNAAFKVVTKLLAAGLVTKDHTGKLLPTQHFAPLRVLGTVEAGFPSPAEEELGDTMPVVFQFGICSLLYLTPKFHPVHI